MTVNKIPAKQMHSFGRGFRKMVAYRTGSYPIKIGYLWSKVKVTVTEYPFFLHNYLLTFLLLITALLCPIKIKFSLSFRFALGRFVFEFNKIRMVDDVIVMKFSANNCVSCQIVV